MKFKIQTPNTKAGVALPILLLGQSPYKVVGGTTRKVTRRTRRLPPDKRLFLEPGKLASWGKPAFFIE